MFDKAMKKSIEPYLQPGEDALHVMIVQGKGMIGALAGGGALGAAALGAVRDRKGRDAAADGDGQVQLAGKMGLVITTRRLLIFKAGGAMALKAKELITDIPLADVDSIEARKGKITKPLAITVRGEEFLVEAAKVDNTASVVSAFERAKAGAASAA